MLVKAKKLLKSSLQSRGEFQGKPAVAKVVAQEASTEPKDGPAPAKDNALPAPSLARFLGVTAGTTALGAAVGGIVGANNVVTEVEVPIYRRRYENIEVKGKCWRSTLNRPGGRYVDCPTLRTISWRQQTGTRTEEQHSMGSSFRTAGQGALLGAVVGLAGGFVAAVATEMIFASESG